MQYYSGIFDLDKEELIKSLDTWTIKSEKRKKVEKPEGIIENLGEGTSVLLPANSKGQNVWNISSGEESSDETQFVPVKSKIHCV